MIQLPDEQARKQALDPYQSFIVQAPAGSGKTELLIQRFLVLLAHAEKVPEEIVAITFTRKAATEMRQRVLDALALAQLPAPASPHARKTWELAQNVLLQNDVKKWNLLEYPQRLCIQTIDSLCSTLTRRMPLLSGLGNQPEIIEDATRYYLEAARRLTTSLESHEPHTVSLSHLLLHLNNDLNLLEGLFVNMLSKRDQWLPYLAGIHPTEDLSIFKKMLEDSLKQVITEALSKCYDAIPYTLQSELIDLLNFAIGHMQNAPSEYCFTQCKSIDTLPLPHIQNCPFWLFIANLLLTQENTCRKTVNKNHGFPPEYKDMKIRMLSFLQSLSDHPDLCNALAALRICPPHAYTDIQWKTLSALIELLPILTAELNLLFNEKNVSDFTEITLAAIRALGDLESPSELALILDYQIRHLLIDEFQDTSHTQFKFIMQLISGWENGDNRTLFLVGDPMQSIYRFREAEVGLFLKAQQEGIGHIILTPLFLQANFRSTPLVVDWVNTHFKNIFPENVDISSGAVLFNPSISMQDQNEASEVQLHSHFETADQTKNIIEMIQEELTAYPDHSIAVLVRSRTHLMHIIPALKRAGIAFNAIEIESLQNQPLIYDLLSLTTALLHLNDRIAWLSILRAPWCGLSLQDLHILFGENHRAIIWEVLQNFENNISLSEDGKSRLRHIIPILRSSLNQKERLLHRTWVEQTWKALNGIACLSSHHELEISKVFFSILEETEIADNFFDIKSFAQKLNKKFATSENNIKNKLTVMTIHKSKGLEFDTVILPHLESKGKNEQERLLRWLDRPRMNGVNDLLLAPIKSKTDTEDAIYRYLHLTETKKIQYEMARLLYVAITRAKKKLHLLANISVDHDKPSQNSFLSLLYMHFTEKLSIPSDTFKHTPPLQINNRIQNILLKRLMLEEVEKNVFVPNHTKMSHVAAPALPDVTLSEINKSIGIITHRILEKISLFSLNEWTEEKILKEKPLWKKWLTLSGASFSEIEQGLSTITQLIMRTVNDPRGRWILKNRSEQSNELKITTVQDKIVSNLIIDRTFIDDDQIRWIIDYKTHFNENVKEEFFLDEMQRIYTPQMNSYALAMQKTDYRPIRLGLYFPAFSGWREWQYMGEPHNAKSHSL